MRIIVACVAFALLACETGRPVAYSLRKEAGTDCVNYCGELGMQMSAVVIIANMTGCVCEPKSGKQAAAGGPAAATGGAVAAVLAAQAAQQQQAAAQSSRH